MTSLKTLVDSLTLDPSTFTASSLTKGFNEISKTLSSPESTPELTEDDLYRFAYSCHTHSSILQHQGPIDQLLIKVISIPAPKFLMGFLRLLSAFLTINSSIRHRVVELCRLRSSIFSSSTNTHLVTIIMQKIEEFDPKIKQSTVTPPHTPRAKPLADPLTPIISVNLKPDAPFSPITSPAPKEGQKYKTNLDFYNPTITSFLGSFGIPGSDDGAPSTALFNLPNCIIKPERNRIFIIDSGNFSLRSVDLNNEGHVESVSTVVTESGKVLRVTNIVQVQPISLIDGMSMIAINTNDCQVSTIALNFSFIHPLFGNSRGQIPGPFSSCAITDPTSFVVHGQHIYLTDASAIWMASLDRKELSIIAGKAGQVGLVDGVKALFNRPSCIVLYKTKSFLVCDSANHVVRLVKWDSTKGCFVTSTLVGSSQGFSDGGLLKSKLNFPLKIVLDPSKRYMFLTDLNPSIRLIDLVTSSVTTIWQCTDQSSFFSSMIFDEEFNRLLVVDSDNHRIVALNFEVEQEYEIKEIKKRSHSHVTPSLTSRSENFDDFGTSVYQTENQKNISEIISKCSCILKTKLTSTRLSAFKTTLSKTPNNNVVFILRVLSLITGENISDQQFKLFEPATADEWTLLKSYLVSPKFRVKLKEAHPSNVFELFIPQLLSIMNTVSACLSSGTVSLSPPFLHALYEWTDCFLRGVKLLHSSKVMRTPLFSRSQKESSKMEKNDEDHQLKSVKEEELELENELLKKQNELLTLKVEELTVLLNSVMNQDSED
ncbi:hypothetical protein P9112_013096 [Eukaryota sp. TZLM1-RC]